MVKRNSEKGHYRWNMVTEVQCFQLKNQKLYKGFYIVIFGQIALAAKIKALVGT